MAKVNAAGTGLAYVTFLGSAQRVISGVSNPNAATLAYAITADTAGNAYVSGSTWAANFPATPSAFQPELPLPPKASVPPPTSAYVAKIDPTGSRIIWATFLGGTSADQANTIAIDPTGNIWVSGTTQSADFPFTSGAGQAGPFLAEFDASGASLLYAKAFPASAALAIDPAGTIHCAAANYGLVSTFTPGQSPVPRLFNLGNAAGGLLSNHIAPGEVISIYGMNLGPSPPITASPGRSLVFPTRLGGIEMTINGRPAPLLYASDTQVIAVTPSEPPSGATPALQMTVNTVALPDLPLVMHTALPAVFSGVMNQDGTRNSKDSPAPVGSFVSIWATGIGALTTYGSVDGQIAPSAFDSGCCLIHDVMQNKDLQPAYAGDAPTLVHEIVQINFQVTSGNGTYATYSLHTRSYAAESSQFLVYVSR